MSSRIRLLIILCFVFVSCLGGCTMRVASSSTQRMHSLGSESAEVELPSEIPANAVFVSRALDITYLPLTDGMLYYVEETTGTAVKTSFACRCVSRNFTRRGGLNCMRDSLGEDSVPENASFALYFAPNQD